MDRTRPRIVRQNDAGKPFLVRLNTKPQMHPPTPRKRTYPRQPLSGPGVRRRIGALKSSVRGIEMVPLCPPFHFKKNNPALCVLLVWRAYFASGAPDYLQRARLRPSRPPFASRALFLDHCLGDFLRDIAEQRADDERYHNVDERVVE
jgi:hypothetical protein